VPRTAGYGNSVAHPDEVGKLTLELRGFPLWVNTVIPVQTLTATYSKQGFFFIPIENMGARILRRQRALTNGDRSDRWEFLHFVSNNRHPSNPQWQASLRSSDGK
jgi:hypothetical protein